MNNPRFPYKLYLVVSEANCKLGMLKVVEEAILGGVDMVQLREKHLNTEDYLRSARRLKTLTDSYNIPLVINDNLQVAQQVNSFGIHVGCNDIPPTVIRKTWHSWQSIGYSVEYLHQLQTEEAATADYLAVSPVFDTPTKTDTVNSWGLKGIETIRQLTTKPLIAIGGIGTGNVREVMNAGADCIAVISAICSAEDPQKAAYQLKEAIIKPK
ncbi:thiamine phosphate synthase [Pedobacter miscanthi]|uniref:Thiamine-phosphate synthase n=1 Tax=Pedobacter miscanthi TaxID=2259170 RepID=A0A366LC68_9SPHI|nr:thiamine phosphate synthase [Pedobacter miscanthi]RBQ11485.1 thiamine phosphate synthase [Pedobacter miscanthi]